MGQLLSKRVPVTFGDKQKRVRVYRSFDKLEEKCRTKFDIPDGRIAIKAQVTNGQRFDVEDDDNLVEVKQDVVAFRIQSEGSRSVVVAGSSHQIDQTPTPDTQLVQQMLAELREDDDDDLKGMLMEISHVADLFNLAATAMPVDEDVEKVHALQSESYNLIVFLTQLSHATDLFYTKSKVTCGLVLETVMTAANFHLDGFSDVAAQELATLGGTTRGMVERCKDLKQKVDEGIAKVGEIQNDVKDRETALEKDKKTQKDLPTEIRKKKMDVEREQMNYDDAKSGVNERQERSGDLRKKLSKAAGGSAATSATVAGLVGTGLAKGTLAMSASVAGIPLALIALTGGLLYACNKSIKDMNAQQVADEAMIAERRRQETEAKKELLDLKHKLQRLRSVDVKLVQLCIHTLEGQLKLLRLTLISWADFWERLSVIFFQRQNRKEDTFQRYSEMDEERLRAVMCGSSFRSELVKYMALWVAFREHSEEMQREIQANIGPLHQLMKRNLTREQAEQQLRITAGRKE